MEKYTLSISIGMADTIKGMKNINKTLRLKWMLSSKINFKMLKDGIHMMVKQVVILCSLDYLMRYDWDPISCHMAIIKVSFYHV